MTRTLSPKAKLRSTLRRQLKQLSAEARSTASAQACSLLQQQSAWQNAKTVFCYAPFSEELDVWALVRDGLAARKTVCLPRFDATTKRYIACEIQDVGKDIADGQFGIREPNIQCVAVPLNRLDLILVPGMAFDLNGHRLGRGKGFYDRLLSETKGIRCGVAFDEQIVEEIPVEPHDAVMDCIVTPTRWIEF
jgi:5-formyltetrahydrofolate cyclo-ligase